MDITDPQVALWTHVYDKAVQFFTRNPGVEFYKEDGVWYVKEPTTQCGQKVSHVIKENKIPPGAGVAPPTFFSIVEDAVANGATDSGLR